MNEPWRVLGLVRNDGGVVACGDSGRISRKGVRLEAEAARRRVRVGHEIGRRLGSLIGGRTQGRLGRGRTDLGRRAL